MIIGFLPPSHPGLMLQSICPLGFVFYTQKTLHIVTPNHQKLSQIPGNSPKIIQIRSLIRVLGRHFARRSALFFGNGRQSAPFLVSDSSILHVTSTLLKNMIFENGDLFSTNLEQSGPARIDPMV